MRFPGTRRPHPDARAPALNDDDEIEMIGVARRAASAAQDGVQRCWALWHRGIAALLARKARFSALSADGELPDVPVEYSQSVDVEHDLKVIADGVEAAVLVHSRNRFVHVVEASPLRLFQRS